MSKQPKKKKKGKKKINIVSPVDEPISSVVEPVLLASEPISPVVESVPPVIEPEPPVAEPISPVPLATKSALVKKKKNKNKNKVKKSKLKAKSIHIGDYHEIVSSHIATEIGFKDPTKILPKRRTGSSSFFSQSIIEKQRNDIERQRILTINCHDEDITNEAVYNLLEGFHDYEYRMLSVTSELLNESKIKFDSFVDNKIGEKNGEKIIVVLDIREKTFISSNLKTRIGHLSFVRIIERLETKKIMLICLANDKGVRRKVKSNKDELGFSIWEIPFLNYFLNKYLTEKSETEIKELIKKLEKQRSNGLWGEKEDDEEFYQNIKTSIRNGEQKFLKEVKKKDKFKKGNVKKFLKENIELINHEELLSEENVLQMHVAYVATFFPDLRLNEFRKLVSFLLQGLTIEKEGSKEVIKNGKTKIVNKTSHYPASEIWENTADKVMRDCYLISRPVVDFNENYLRKNLILFFEERFSNFLQKQHDKILNSNLFFDDNLSKECIKNIFSLSAKMANEEPKYYGFNLLVSIAEAIGKENPIINLKIQPEQREEVFSKVIEVELIRHFIIYRLSDLLKSMLEYENSKEEVKNFLNRLINSRWHEFTLHLLKRMPFDSSFDKLYWIRQLLDRGNDKTRKGTYQYLLRLAHFYDGDIYEFLSEIKNWFPIKNTEEPYSHSSYCAIRFIIDYALGSFDTKMKLGENPSTYPLFSSEEGKEMPSDKKEFLLEWLYHPDMPNAYELVGRLFIEELSGKVLPLNELRVSVLETWFKILFGYKKKSQRSVNVKFYKSLNKGLALIAEKKEQQELIIEMRKKMTGYAAKATFIQREYFPPSRKKLKEKEKIVKQLQRNYKSLEKMLRFLETNTSN